MDDADADRSFARRGRNALDGALSYVADGEDSRHGRLEHERRAFAAELEVALTMPARRDVAPRVALN